MRALPPPSGSGAKPAQDNISENHLEMPRLNLRTEVLLDPFTLRILRQHGKHYRIRLLINTHQAWQPATCLYWDVPNPTLRLGVLFVTPIP